MIAITPVPSAVSNTMRARLAIFWRVLPSATMASSSARSLRESTISIVLRPMPPLNHIGTRFGFKCL